MNNFRIEANKRHLIKHGDKLRIGKNSILLHIHKGSITCINCEPGEVMEKFKKENHNVKQHNYEREANRRTTNRELKKK